MEIHNAVEMYTFLYSIGMIPNKAVEINELYNCVSSISTCACKTRDDTLKHIQRCNKLYMDMVKSLTPPIKHEIFSKISDQRIMFYTDYGELIMSISR